MAGAPKLDQARGSFGRSRPPTWSQPGDRCARLVWTSALEAASEHPLSIATLRLHARSTRTGHGRPRRGHRVFAGLAWSKRGQCPGCMEAQFSSRTRQSPRVPVLERAIEAATLRLVLARNGRSAVPMRRERSAHGVAASSPHWARQHAEANAATASAAARRLARRSASPACLSPAALHGQEYGETDDGPSALRPCVVSGIT